MADKYREKLAKFILEEVLGERFKELEHEDKPDLQNKDLGIGVEVVRAIIEKEAEQEGTIHNLMSGKARDEKNSIVRLSSSGVAVKKYVGRKLVIVCPKSSVVFEDIPSTIGLLEKLIGSLSSDSNQNSLVGKWAKELIEANPELVSKLENFYKLLADMRKRIDDSIKPKMKGKPCLLNKDIDEIIEKLGWNEEFDKKFSEIERSLKGETNLENRGMTCECIDCIKKLKCKIDAVKQGKYNEGEEYAYFYPTQVVKYKEIYSALEDKLKKLNKNQYGEFKNQYLFIYHNIIPIDREEANNIRTKLKEKQSNFEKKFSSIFVYSASQQKETLFEFGESGWSFYNVPKDKIMKQQRKLLQGLKKN